MLSGCDLECLGSFFLFVSCLFFSSVHASGSTTLVHPGKID